jgi:replicative DNA helicase
MTVPLTLDPLLFDVSYNYVQLLDRRFRGSSPDFSTSGFISLDKEFPGFLHNGHLIVIAGRPGSGKSVLCQQLAEFVAQEKTVLFVSYEMSALELSERSVARASGVSLPRLRHARGLDSGDFAAVADALAKIQSFNLRISDECSTIDDLAARLLAYPGELAAFDLPPLGMVVVDYLQLIPSSDRRASLNRSAEVGAVSRRLKRLAQELQVPILSAAQINRETESRPDKRPHLGDLRESGSIEQDSDFVAFVYRDELHDQNSREKGVAEFICRKNRHGSTGAAKLRFSGEKVAFSDIPSSASPSIPQIPSVVLNGVSYEKWV